jgi:hypothetical protein
MLIIATITGFKKARVLLHEQLQKLKGAHDQQKQLNRKNA